MSETINTNVVPTFLSETTIILVQTRMFELHYIFGYPFLVLIR